MTAIQALALLLLILGSCVLAGLARRRGVAAPILLVLTGLAASYIPGVPVFRLQPDVILFLVLPPLVYMTALESSYLNLRDHLRTLTLLSVGLVLFTAAVVGGATWLAVPGLRLRREMTVAERAELIRLRDQRRIDDEVLDEMLRQLDLKEAMLSRDEWDMSGGDPDSPAG